MLLLMIGFKVNIGLAAFFASAILVLCGVAKDGEALKALPWSTIIMVVAGGALVLLAIISGLTYGPIADMLYHS